MSEKVYALLLRLYPADFLREYGEDALQLFRDRYQDETGFFVRLRLWWDLLSDLAVSVPGEYSGREGVFAGGLPSFQILGNESPHPAALLVGALLTLASLGASSLVPNGTPRWGQLLQASTVADDGNPDAAMHNRLIDQVIANVREHYFDQNLANQMADALREHQKRGDYSRVTDDGELAGLLTRHLRDVSHDMHLEVVYSRETLPNRPQGPTPESQTRYRQEMEQANCTFEKVQMLPKNVGYLKLNSFPDVSACESTAVAAMASLNHADAIIFDLRENRGGFPDMVSLIAAYLFDHPEYMYNPREAPTERSWTKSPVPGNRLADKPVFVLTSASTWSGAEQFCYDLKMLKRATLVGETTRGGAHAGVWRRIDDHFGMGIPEVRAINPFSKADWERTGVVPDIKAKASDALQIAEQLAAAPRSTTHSAALLPGLRSAHR
jgi:hypothetical protein